MASCKICLEKYQPTEAESPCLIPYILGNCGHTLCKFCINKLPNKACPFCRTKFSTIYPNFVLMDILDDINDKEIINDIFNSLEFMISEIQASLKKSIYQSWFEDFFKYLHYVLLKKDYMLSECCYQYNIKRSLHLCDIYKNIILKARVSNQSEEIDCESIRNRYVTKSRHFIKLIDQNLIRNLFN